MDRVAHASRKAPGGRSARSGEDRLLEQFREMQKMMKKAAVSGMGGGKFRPGMFR